jgi:hypothetical protein
MWLMMNRQTGATCVPYREQGEVVKKLIVLVAIAVTAAAALTLVGASGAGATGGTPLTAANGAPLIRAVGHPTAGTDSQPTISLNWSGYAEQAAPNTKFDYVSSEFVQPAVNCKSGKKYVNSSNWVGLDGFANDTVEQDGTGAYCGGAGNATPHYYAWIELYPLNEVVAFNVKPGDIMSAVVRSTDSGTFTLSISDITSGKTKTQTAKCASCQRASAEWIIERPAECNDAGTKCFITPLTNFGTTEMTDNFAGTDGSAPVGLGSMANAVQIFMVQTQNDGGFYSLVNVGAVDPAANAFSVTWLHAGKPVPF